MLVGDGLIETRAGLGTFVIERDSVVSGNGGPPLDRAQIEELIEARLVLESDLSALAAARASAAEIAEFRGIVARMDAAADDPGRFLDAESTSISRWRVDSQPLSVPRTERRENPPDARSGAGRRGWGSGASAVSKDRGRRASGGS